MRDILDRAVPLPARRACAFVVSIITPIQFRSEKALEPTTCLAYEMNGVELPDRTVIRCVSSSRVTFAEKTCEMAHRIEVTDANAKDFTRHKAGAPILSRRQDRELMMRILGRRSR